MVKVSAGIVDLVKSRCGAKAGFGVFWNRVPLFRLRQPGTISFRFLGYSEGIHARCVATTAR